MSKTLTVYCDDKIIAHSIWWAHGLINSWVTFQVCFADFRHAGQIQIPNVVRQGPKTNDGHPFQHLKWDGKMVVRSDTVKDATISFGRYGFPGWNMPGYLITTGRGQYPVMAVINVDESTEISLPDIQCHFPNGTYYYTDLKLIYEILPDDQRRIGCHYVQTWYGSAWEHTEWFQQFGNRDACLYAGDPQGTIALSQNLPEGIQWTCSPHEMDEIVSHIFEPYLPTWDKGDLCQICADGSKAIDINTVMFMKEMMEMGEMVKSTLELFKGKPNPKKLAGAYLSYTYGYKLSYADTVELYNVCRSEAQKVRRESATSRARKSNVIYGYHNVPITFTGTAGMNYSPYPYLEGQILNDLFRWDIFPTFGNLYDWVPWSFVVDWFFPIGPALEAIDYRTYIQTLTINFVCYGRKWEVTNVPNYDRYLYLPWWGRYLQPITALSCSYYHRWYEQQATPPKIESEFPTSFNHWIEGSALLIQKVSK